MADRWSLIRRSRFVPGQNASVDGNIISYANIVIDANGSINLSGFNGLIPANSGPFINRGTITVCHQSDPGAWADPSSTKAKSPSTAAP